MKTIHSLFVNTCSCFTYGTTKDVIRVVDSNGSSSCIVVYTLWTECLFIATIAAFHPNLTLSVLLHQLLRNYIKKIKPCTSAGQQLIEVSLFCYQKYFLHTRCHFIFIAAILYKLTLLDINCFFDCEFAQWSIYSIHYDFTTIKLGFRNVLFKFCDISLTNKLFVLFILYYDAIASSSREASKYFSVKEKWELCSVHNITVQAKCSQNELFVLDLLLNWTVTSHDTKLCDYFFIQNLDAIERLTEWF